MGSIPASIFFCVISCVIIKSDNRQTLCNVFIYLLNYFMVLLNIMSVSQSLRHRMSKLADNVSETRKHFIYVCMYLFIYS